MNEGWWLKSLLLRSAHHFSLRNGIIGWPPAQGNLAPFNQTFSFLSFRLRHSAARLCLLSAPLHSIHWFFLIALGSRHAANKRNQFHFISALSLTFSLRSNQSFFLSASNHHSLTKKEKRRQKKEGWLGAERVKWDGAMRLEWKLMELIGMECWSADGPPAYNPANKRQEASHSSIPSIAAQPA